MKENCIFKDTCNMTKCQACELMNIQKEVLRLANIPEKYRGKLLDENLPKTLNADGIKKLKIYRDNFDKMQENNINMLIFPEYSKINPQGCGTGKTTIACCLAQEFIKQNIKDYKMKPLALFVNAEEFADMKRREVSNKPLSEFEEYILENIETCPLLILDDIGAEKITEFTLQSLYALINTRLNKCKLNIYTTNLTPDALAGILGERLYSRISSALQVQTSGVDLRKEFINRIFA